MYFNHAYDLDASQAQIVGHDVSNPAVEAPIAWVYPCDTPGEILCSGGGLVYIGSTEGKVYALNSDGERVWISSTLGGIAQQSAMYSDGKLFISANTWQMICFDAETGERLWATYKGDRAFSAYRGTVGMGMVFDTTVELDPHGHVRAFDVETGTQLWKQPAYFNIAYTTMACADGKVYTSVCDRSTGIQTGGLPFPGYGTACFDAYTGTKLWELEQNFATPSLAYGNLYGRGGGYIWCIGPPSKDWTHGFIGNVEQPRVAVGQSGPKDISTPKWEYQTGGDVYSSPAVVDGKVYVGSTDFNWYCLDAYTGDKIWNFTIDHYVRSSCAVVNGRVFTGADDGYFYCLDAETGEQIWKVSAGGHFPYLLAAPEAEPRSSPIVMGGRMYVGSLDGRVYCLDTADGSIEWTYTTGKAIMGSPTYSGGIIYIVSTDGYLYALETDGDLAWQSAFTLDLGVGIPDYSEHYAIATPVVAQDEGLVVVAGGVQYGTAAMGDDWYAYYGQSTPRGAWGGGIRMFCFDAETGDSVWNISRAGNTDASYIPAYFDGEIYAGEFFEVTSLDINDPEAGPYYAADFTYGQRRHGNRTWGAWLGYQIQSSVAYADDPTGAKIYVGSDIGSVYCLDAEDGSTHSVFLAAGNVPCSPAIWEGKMYIGATTGKVYCFDDAPTVDIDIWAESNKGAQMYNTETIEICGALTANPIEYVWDPNEEDDYETGSWVATESTFHPGVPNSEVQLYLTKPDGTDDMLTTTTDKWGYFEFSYSPTDVGEWGWVVNFEGGVHPAITYSPAYGEWNPLTVNSPTAGPSNGNGNSNGDGNGNGTEPPPAGLPMEYVYAVIAVIIIVVVAALAYFFLRKK
jgi:outer membrane protein assembly factor BamB